MVKRLFRSVSLGVLSMSLLVMHSSPAHPPAQLSVAQAAPATVSALLDEAAQLAETVGVSNEGQLAYPNRQVQALSDVARAYGQQGDRQRANELLGQAVDLTNTHSDVIQPRTLAYVAAVYDEIGEPETALRLLRQALNESVGDGPVAPTFVQAGELWQITLAYGQLQDTEAANNALAEMIALAQEMAATEGVNGPFSTPPVILIAATTAYAELGNTAGLDTLTQLVQRMEAPQVQAELLIALAEAYQSQGQQQRAQDLLPQATPLAQTVPLADILLGRIIAVYAQSGDAIAAQQGLESVLPMTQEITAQDASSSGWLLTAELAQAYGQLGERAQSEAILTQLAATVGTTGSQLDQVKNVALLADIHSQQGNTAAASALLREAFEIAVEMPYSLPDQGQYVAFSRLAEGYRQLPDPTTAQAGLTRLIHLSTDVENPLAQVDATILLAQVLSQQGETDAAYELLLDATQALDGQMNRNNANFLARSITHLTDAYLHLDHELDHSSGLTHAGLWETARLSQQLTQADARSETLLYVVQAYLQAAKPRPA